MQPKVSIVMPVYNVERYVEQSIRSLMEQTLEDIEIIIVNDGSKDGSRDIVGRLAEEDPRIRIIDNVNSGYGVSINKGFAAATGEYLGILESDDFAEPDAYEKLYNAAKANDADMVKGCFNLYWTDPERFEYFDIFENTDISEDRPGRFDYSCAERVIKPLEYERIFYVKASIWSAIYRTAFLRENNITCRETPGASYQDSSFTFNVLSKAKRLFLLRDVIVNYRQDNSNSSVNSKDKAFVLFGEYEEIDRIIDEDGVEDPETLRKIAAYMKFDAYMWNYNRVHRKYHEELAHRMSEEFKADFERGSFDLGRFESGKWYVLNRIISDPDAFIREWDLGEKSVEDRIKQKAFNAATLLKKEGPVGYAGRLFKKFVIGRIKVNESETEVEEEEAVEIDDEVEVAADVVPQFRVPLYFNNYVSIVMPAYNAESYIEDTVRRILDQTFGNFELIIVDDGSTDSTPEILDRFAAEDKRVRVIHQENQGEGGARIAGFEACRGDWLVSVDADDLVEPQMLDHLVKRGYETDADVVIFRVETLDDQTGEKLPCDWAFRADSELGGVFAPEQMAPTLFNSFQNWVWNKMFRMSFLKAKGIRFQNVRRTADLLFTCSALASAERIALLDEVLYLYRINNPTSAFATSDSAPLDFYHAFCALKAFLEERGLYETYKRTFRNWASDGFRANLMVMRSLDGFNTLLGTFKEEGFSRLEIDQVQEGEWFEEDHYRFCRYMIEHEPDECLYYVLSRVKTENANLMTYSSEIRKAHSDPRVLAKELATRVVRKAKSVLR